MFGKAHDVITVMRDAYEEMFTNWKLESELNSELDKKVLEVSAALELQKKITKQLLNDKSRLQEEMERLERRPRLKSKVDTLDGEVRGLMRGDAGTGQTAGGERTGVNLLSGGVRDGERSGAGSGHISPPSEGHPACAESTRRQESKQTERKWETAEESDCRYTWRNFVINLFVLLRDIGNETLSATNKDTLGYAASSYREHSRGHDRTLYSVANETLCHLPLPRTQCDTI